MSRYQPKQVKVKKGGGGGFKTNGSVLTMMLKVLFAAVVIAIGLVFTFSKLGYDWSRPTRSGRQSNKQKKNLWKSYDNCELVEVRMSRSARKLNENDGDSFNVWCPMIDKERPNFEKEARLYTVDAPESKIKQYGRGQSNQKRVQDQANYFSIDSQQAIEVGQQAQQFTRNWLGSEAKFTIFHANESVYGDSNRVYVYVANGKGELLHEELVREGLVRLRKTKGPDVRLDEWDAAGSWHAGFPRQLLGKAIDEKRLLTLELETKKQRKGAWAFAPADDMSATEL